MLEKMPPAPPGASLELSAFAGTTAAAGKSLLQEFARRMIQSPGAHWAEDDRLSKLQREAEVSAYATQFWRQLAVELADGMRMDQLDLVIRWCQGESLSYEQACRADLQTERAEYAAEFEQLCKKYPTTYHCGMDEHARHRAVDENRAQPKAVTVMLSGSQEQYDCLLDGLKRYVEHGILPGSCMQALLANDLLDFCARADDETMALLPALSRWIYNHTPTACHGSREKVQAYSDSKRKITAP